MARIVSNTINSAGTCKPGKADEDRFTMTKDFLINTEEFFSFAVFDGKNSLR